MFDNQTRWMRRAVGAAAVGGALALALAGPAVGQTSDTTNRQFVNGSVTSVHGTSVQVSNQTQNSESTVTLAPTTQIAKSETATASAITTGACLRVVGTGSASKGITARTVAITQPTDNGCGRGNGQRPAGSGGFRFGNGQRPNGANGSGTNGTRRFPNGGRLANLAIANGPVVSVSGDTVVVKSTTFARPTTTSSKSKGKSRSSSTKTQATRPKATTSNVTVTLTSSTTLMQTVAGTSADIAVGSCVTATGTTAGAGITADRVDVSAPVNGACTGGFGGFGGRFGGGGNGGSRGSSGSGGNGQV